jgi:hypothetical protein
MKNNWYIVESLNRMNLIYIADQMLEFSKFLIYFLFFVLN